MQCIKCRKPIPEKSKFCNWCGVPQKKVKYYRRPDGLYEKIITIHGKRVAFRAKTVKEIERKMLEYSEKEEQGELFSVVAEQWKESHFPTLAFNTLKGYRPAYRSAVEFFGDKLIRSISLSDVKAYIASLPKSWAQKTMANYELVLNLIFEFAAENEYIDANPAQYARLPKGRKKTHRRAPTQEEIDLINNSLGVPFGLFAFLILYTGCRKGEALALQYKDIDRDGKTVHICKSIYHDDSGNPHLKSPKTEKGNRDIILIDLLERAIPEGKPNDYIFSDGGNLIRSSKFDKLWREYQQATGLTITPHIIRHGYASILHEAGIDKKDAQELLGHSNISTTLDIYTHISQKKWKDTARKLQGYIQNTQESQ